MCCSPSGRRSESEHADLTIQNDGPDPVTFQLTAADRDGATQANGSERLDSGVGQALSVTVGTTGRHEVTVAGQDWRERLARNADTCARFDGSVRVSDAVVPVAGECLEGQRGLVGQCRRVGVVSKIQTTSIRRPVKG